MQEHVSGSKEEARQERDKHGKNWTVTSREKAAVLCRNKALLDRVSQA